MKSAPTFKGLLSRRRILLIGVMLPLIAGGTVAIMRDRASRPPVINVEGIDDLGLKVEIPGGAENPGDFIIRNSGTHTVVAYRMVYEGHAKSGEIHEWSTTMIQPLAFPSNRDLKPEYLTPRYGCIPPGTFVFGGLLRDVEAQDGKTMPEVEFKRVFIPPAGFEYYEHIDARLDSVMLEDGTIHGRNKGALIGKTRQTFEEEMREFLGLPPK